MTRMLLDAAWLAEETGAQSSTSYETVETSIRELTQATRHEAVESTL